MNNYASSAIIAVALVLAGVLILGLRVDIQFKNIVEVLAFGLIIVGAFAFIRKIL